MDIKKCVENISTFTDLKRSATEYVIDYKRLSLEELKAAVIKTAPQYFNSANIKTTMDSIELNSDRNIRILSEIIILHILLNADDFMLLKNECEDKVLAYEQKMIDEANELDIDKAENNIAFFKYVLEAAWEHNNDVSVDEQNLINKIKAKMGINRHTNNVLEAKIAKYPTVNNKLHTKGEIDEVRRFLQQKGILFSVRDSNNADYDIIPFEIGTALRRYYKIDLKETSFSQLLDFKYVRNKKYLTTMLEKSNISIPATYNLAEIKASVIDNLNGHIILGGYSPNDGLDRITLSHWCAALSLSVSGTKNELIDRIIEYYDGIKQITVDETDDRVLFYEFYTDLATRNLSELRKQGVISKDIECERKFETATNYLFEKKLKVKPLIMNGTEHPDGMLSFNDKLILWDNKSKETEVSLADHIKQFDRYINNSEKPVSVFMVIAPSFTEDSASECVKYSMSNDTLILLITANELKTLAENWSTKHKNDDEAFPLGYFRQNGRFNADLVKI